MLALRQLRARPRTALGIRATLYPRPLVRFVTTEAEQEADTDTDVPAHIAASGEAARAHASVYISNVLPIQFTSWDMRPALARMREEVLMEELKTIADELKGRHAFRVESWEVTRKEGGVFCHFTYMPPKLEELPRKAFDHTFHTPEDQKPDPTSAAALFLPLWVQAAKKHGGWPSWLGKWWSNFLADGTMTKGARHVQEAGHLVYSGDMRPIKPGDETEIELRGWQKMAGVGRVWMVRGRQWTEDMNRFPSARLRVEFDGADVSQEMLYTLFRPYGRIHDIQPPTPVASGALRFALLSFRRVSPSVTASNCLHGFPSPTNSADHDLRREQPGAEIKTTRLRIYFERPLKAHYVRDWISAHPRIALPVIAFLIGTLSYMVFDPIREFFVRSHMEGIWDIEKYAPVKFLKDNVWDPVKNTFFDRMTRKRRRHIDDLGRASWRDRLEAEHNVERWLSEYPSTFVVVTGPPGSGKHDLVDRVIKGEKKAALIIDCAEIAKSKSDGALVSALADQTGYWPVFSFLQSINGLIDLASVGLIGQKAGFSTPIDQQLRSMLEIVGTALKDVAANSRDAREKAQKCREDQLNLAADRERELRLIRRGVWHDGRLDCVAGNGIMSELGLGIEAPYEDDFDPAPPLMDGTAPIDGEGVPPSAASIDFDSTAAAAVISDETPVEEDGEQESLKSTPIVVLRNFALKPARGDLWNVLAEWGASLIENKVAHVIVVGEGSVTSKTLTQALPSKPLNQISLADADDHNSLEFVREKLAAPDKPYDLDLADRNDISKLGGRMVDLELLVYKVRSGQTIHTAVDDIVHRNVVEIRKSAFGDDSEDAKHIPWTRPQAWKIVTALAKENKISFAKLLSEFPFKGADTALKAMEEHDLVSIQYDEGRPTAVRPGKPVFREAFKMLVDEPVFHAMNQIEYNAAIQKKAEAEIADFEAELARLKDIAMADKLGVADGSWFGLTKGSPIHQRAQYLVAELGKRMDKLRAMEADSADQLKKFSKA